MISNLLLTNDTTPEQLDTFFTNTWRKKERVKLVIDATKCSNISLKRVVSIKGVLDKHRENSRANIDFTFIFVKSNFVKNIIRMGLFIIKTERPVYVEKLKIINK
tara:strand:- start:8298 stop:8612 length:315 start_codon:yes stop_codon:yes gene_type:complete